MRTLAFVATVFYLIGAWPPAAEAAKEWYDYYQEGLLAMRNQRWAEAIENLEKAIAGNPQSKKRVVTPGNWILTDYYPYLQLGIAHLRSGQPETAEKYLNKALSSGVEPRVEAYKYLAEVDELKRRMAEQRFPELRGGELSEVFREPPSQATPAPAPVPTKAPTSTPAPTPTLEVAQVPAQKPVPPPIPTPTPSPLSETAPAPVQKVTPSVLPATTPTPKPVETPTPLPTPAALTGNLYIESIPSEGTVFLNNQKKGETPLNLDHIKEGIYEVEIVKRGYPIYRARVTVVPNEINKYVYTLGEYDCDYNSSPDRSPSRAVSLEAFMKPEQVAEVDYDKGDCTDWFSVEIHKEGKWAFEMQLLDNPQANVELQVYGPDSSTKLLGSGTRHLNPPGVIRFASESPLPAGLYYLVARAKGKGDRVLYSLRYYPTEEVVAAETPVATGLTPTPASNPTPAQLSAPPAKTAQRAEPEIKWRKIPLKHFYGLLALTSVVICLAVAAIFLNLKSKFKQPRKPKSVFEKVRRDLAVAAPSLPHGGPVVNLLEEDDEVLFLMRLDSQGK